MPLNTYVAGDPGSLRELIDTLRGLSSGIERAATGWHHTRSRSETDWQGPAAEAYRETARNTGRDADELENTLHELTHCVEEFTTDLDTVLTRMSRAREVARQGGLMVLGEMIHQPRKISAPTIGGLATEPNDPNASGTGGEWFARAEATYTEVETLVTAARTTERTAHERLGAALDRIGKELRELVGRSDWRTAANSADHPAAAGLSETADALEKRSAETTRVMMREAVANGPDRVRGVWETLTAAQRADLEARFPRLVGDADGLPVAVRHEANTALLARERNRLREQIREVVARARAEGRSSSDAAESLYESLDTLEELQAYLRQDEKYLLSLDGTADNRGRVIVASGNPDTADHVATFVPGTRSDLGNAMDYIVDGDKVRERAEQLAPGEDVANITYLDYESPDSLVSAARESFAENGSADLARFQEGLRISHQGPVSHNTIIGHSYGTTVIGYTASGAGLAVDDMVFMGSPGVGTWRASELGIPSEHVWSGTAPLDPIRSVPDGWFGQDPNNPFFGAREVPVDAMGDHNTYWDDRESVDGMARIVAGRAAGTD
ncbi:Alpha/beta hydrolase [Actinopolyspora alba]|uniref:Alpha/beta hydrolase n=1 Tax=Actinopolyspora alba TaxID=673379 RepID=A0A1I1TUC5_9ACTN|nr:alpha/beta hydrolase [Actinopolyspora alba]SFD59110.1 Alpha/beta hydrolase [Actinopolyspora alba]